MASVELNYYWGDGTFHSSERGLSSTNIPALVQENKPRHASVAYCIVYVDDKYYTTVEVL